MGVVCWPNSNLYGVEGLWNRNRTFKFAFPSPTICFCYVKLKAWEYIKLCGEIELWILKIFNLYVMKVVPPSLEKKMEIKVHSSILF